MFNEVTTQKAKEVILTENVRLLVSDYIVAKTVQQLLQEEINKIYEIALEKFELYADNDFCKRTDEYGKRIVKAQEMYLSTDDETCKQIWHFVHVEAIKQGIKPDDMPEEHCPALVALNIVVDCENAIIDATAIPLGIDPPNLYRYVNNELAREKWLDLIVKIIINAPGFKKPDIHEAHNRLLTVFK